MSYVAGDQNAVARANTAAERHLSSKHTSDQRSLLSPSRVNLRHSQPCPECRLLEVERTKSARKRISASECRLLGDKRAYRRHGWNFAS